MKPEIKDIKENEFCILTEHKSRFFFKMVKQLENSFIADFYTIPSEPPARFDFLFDSFKPDRIDIYDEVQFKLILSSRD